MRRLLFAVALLAAPAAQAYCPCYTLSSQYNTHDCGIEAVAGKNPTVAEWQKIFDLVSQGPKVWGNAGPPLGPIGQGCGKPEKLHDVDASFPCELIRAIAMAETGWRQFCRPDTPKDQAPDPERTIISFDCGYGIGQVTSGMHKGENPAFDRRKVAADPTYNLATGMQILASKWRATNCVGDNQPKVVEHWYTATWAYNGLAYSNNPSNPNLDPKRGVYNPKVGGSYTYQEKVWGWIQNPPSAAYWTSVALAYPNRADVGNKGSPPDLPEPSCASPTDCVNKRPVHRTACGAPPPPPPDLAAVRDLAAPRDLAVAAADLAGPQDLAVVAADLGAPRDLATGGDPGRPVDGGGDRSLPGPDDAAPLDGGSGFGAVQGGCGCRLGGAADGDPVLLLFAGLLLLLPLRRRRTLSRGRWL